MVSFLSVLVFVGLGLILFGVPTALSNLNNLVRRKRILTTPTSPVRQAMGGLVKIKGHIVPSEEGLVVAPFTGREVVWARVTVTHITGSQSGTSSTVVLSEVDSRPFFVDDDSGEVARILPQDANIVVDKAVVSKGFDRPPPHVEDFLRARDISDKELLGLLRKSMSYVEELLAPGDALYALGPSRRDPGPPVSDDTGLAPSSQLVMSADPGAHGELILTNKTEEQLASRLLRWFVVGLIGASVGALAVLVGVLLLVTVYRASWTI